jgi:hypothetical protein
MSMGTKRDQSPVERATALTIKAKRITLLAVTQRVNQEAGFYRARRAALEAIEGGKTESEIIIAAGDAYFSFIKQTSEVESQ